MASGRAGNVIGGGDWADDRLIPDILRAVAKGEPVSIRNPISIRPRQHVLEPVGGYLVLAQALWSMPEAAAEAWNFGPRDDDAQPVQWIVERMCEARGNGATWVHDENVQPHEARYLKLDISKARAGLRWTPRWSLAQALESIVAGIAHGWPVPTCTNIAIPSWSASWRLPSIKPRKDFCFHDR